jgi:hypothetical protein
MAAATSVSSTGSSALRLSCSVLAVATVKTAGTAATSNRASRAGPVTVT